MRCVAACTAALMLVVGGQALGDDFCVVGAEVHIGDGVHGQFTVCVRGDRVVEVVTEASAPEGFAVVDGTGLVLTPGFVDVNTNLGLVEVWAVESSRDGNAGGRDPIRAAFRVADALDPDSSLLPVARTGGITSAGCLPSGGLISGQATWIDLVEHADLAVEGPGVMVMGLGVGAGAQTGGSRGGAILRYREIFEDVRFYAEHQNAYDANQARELSLSRLDLEALMPVLEGDVPVLFGASERRDVRAGLAMAREYGLEVAFIGALDTWAMADELAEAGAAVVVNALYNLPFSFEALGAREDAAAILESAGVEVILSSNDTHNVRTLRQVAGNAVRAGLPWDAALQAVTSRPARLFGVDDRYGTIAVGQVANLVLWTGDPFELSTSVSQMWIRGEDQSLRTRQTELLERYR